MKNKKIALILSILMIIGILPVQSFANGLTLTGDAGASSGGRSHSIATFDLTWKGSTEAHNELILNPQSGNSGLEKSYAIANVSFSIGGDETLAPFSAKITLPKNLFFDRDDPTKSVTDPVLAMLTKEQVEAGSTNSILFCYSFDDAKTPTDETDDLIVIENYAEISATTGLNTDISYEFYDMDVKDGSTTSEINANVVVTSTPANITAQSSDLSISAYTDAKQPYYFGGSKTSQREIWDPAWGERPSTLPAEEDVFYLVYESTSNYWFHAGSQPSNLHYKLENNGTTDFEVVGWYSNNNAVFNLASDSNKLEDFVFSSFDTPESALRNLTKTIPFKTVLCYNKADVATNGNSLKITETLIAEGLDPGVEGYDEDSPIDTDSLPDNIEYVSRDKEHTYAEVNFDYKGDNFSVSIDEYYKTSGLELLEAGRDLTGQDKVIRVNNYSPELTRRHVSEIDAADLDKYDVQGEYAYGYYDMTTVLESGNIFIEGNAATGDVGYFLEPENYEYTSFDLRAAAEYESVADPALGRVENLITDYDTYSPIKVYVKRFDGDTSDDVWEEVGSVNYKGSSPSSSYYTQYDWTPLGGTTERIDERYDSVDLGDNVYDVKFESTSKRAQVAFGVKLHYQLNYNDKIVDYITTNHELNTIDIANGYVLDHTGANVLVATEDEIISNPLGIKAMIVADDNATYGRIVAHDAKETPYVRPTLNTLIQGTYKVTTTDDDKNFHSQSRVSYVLKAYETFNISYPDGVTNEDIIDRLKLLEDTGIFTDQEEGEFYFLMPEGTSVDTSTIKVAQEKASNTFYEPTSTEFYYDWQGSGRTMMVVTAEIPKGETNNYTITSGTIRIGYHLHFDLINSWENVSENGTFLRNNWAYVSTLGALAKGSPDDTTPGSGMGLTHFDDKGHFSDLDGDGNPAGTINNVIYGALSLQLTEPMTFQYGVSKSVLTSGQVYASTTDVLIGDTYSYKLKYANSDSSVVSDLVLYDVLENAAGSNESWKGTFNSITTEVIDESTDVKVEPIVYYSTKTDFEDTTENYTGPKIDDTSVWSTTPPADKSAITAIAVDLREDTEGNPYTFNKEASVIATVVMDTPRDYAAVEGKLAYNNVYAELSSTGGAALALHKAETTTVSIRDAGASIKKDALDNTGVSIGQGSEETPVIVKPGDEVVYSLTVENTDPYIPITNAIVSDLIPQGLTVDTANLSYSTGTYEERELISDPSSAVSYSETNGLYNFTIDKINTGQTVTIYIPITVEESDIINTFINKANLYIDSFGETKNYESNTVYHELEGTVYTVHHELEQTDGTYLRVDADSQTLLGIEGSNVTPPTNTYEGFTSPTVQTKVVAADGSMVIIYQYDRIDYVVDYEAHGGSPTPEDETVSYEEKATEPTILPEKDGYIFEGWYIDDGTFENKYDFNTLVTGNITLYAKWTPIPVTDLGIGTDTGADPDSIPVQTGDNSNLMLFFAVMLVSLSGIGVITYKRKRQK